MFHGFFATECLTISDDEEETPSQPGPETAIAKVAPASSQSPHPSIDKDVSLAIKRKEPVITDETSGEEDHLPQGVTGEGREIWTKKNLLGQEIPVLEPSDGVQDKLSSYSQIY